jgi:hypothetical protein
MTFRFGRGNEKRPREDAAPHGLRIVDGSPAMISRRPRPNRNVVINSIRLFQMRTGAVYGLPHIHNRICRDDSAVYTVCVRAEVSASVHVGPRPQWVG